MKRSVRLFQELGNLIIVIISTGYKFLLKQRQYLFIDLLVNMPNAEKNNGVRKDCLDGTHLPFILIHQPYFWIRNFTLVTVDFNACETLYEALFNL
jgi:hypothetical protein